MALLEFAFVIIVNRRATQNKETKKDARKESNEGRTTVSNKKDVNFMNSQAWMSETTKGESRIQKRMPTMPSIQSVDFIALGLHFVSFLLFNIIYWMNQS